MLSMGDEGVMGWVIKYLFASILFKVLCAAGRDYTPNRYDS